VKQVCGELESYGGVLRGFQDVEQPFNALRLLEECSDALLSSAHELGVWLHKLRKQLLQVRFHSEFKNNWRGKKLSRFARALSRSTSFNTALV
jgi:hypothetical protein